MVSGECCQTQERPSEVVDVGTVYKLMKSIKPNPPCLEMIASTAGWQVTVKKNIEN